jgi:protein-serine/threonine kinase
MAMRVNQYRIVRKKPLGTGWQSKVYLVEDIEKSGLPKYAMKVMELRKLKKITRKATDSKLWIEDAQGEPNVWVEVAVGKLLCHRNIVPLVEVVTSEEELCMVLELQEGVLKKKRDLQPFELHEAKRCIKELAEGVAYMHARGVIHRDLKVENILMYKDGTVKISDFGMAHIIEQGEGDLLTLGIGSRKYRAPELFKDGQYSGFAADVWSVGVILYCLVTGYLPFEGKQKKDQAYSIQHQQLVFPARIEKETALVDLLTSILQKDPSLRIGLDQIQQHPWLR